MVSYAFCEISMVSDGYHKMTVQLLIIFKSDFRFISQDVIRDVSGARPVRTVKFTFTVLTGFFLRKI